MKVIEYIKKNGLTSLKENLKIHINYYIDRIILNYDRLKSPLYNPIVKECRGLILEYPSLKILCRPFDRFYNRLQDPKYQEFNVSECICFEKLDGTLCNVYHDGNKWIIATRKTAFAEGSVTCRNISYKKYFESIIDENINKLFSKLGLSKECTHIFEIVGPDNKIVTRYQEPKIYLLSIRNNITGKEIIGSDIRISTIDFYTNVAKHIGVSYPKYWKMKSWNNILDLLKKVKSLEEKYVLYWPEKQWRIKV